MQGSVAHGSAAFSRGQCVWVPPLPILPFGLWGPLCPASSMPATFGRMLSGAKGKGEEGGCPIPTKMIFSSIFFFTFFFFFLFLAI